METETVTLELEFKLIKQIYTDLLLAKDTNDVDNIFNKYLKNKYYIWETSPYIFYQYDRKLMGINS